MRCLSKFEIRCPQFRVQKKNLSLGLDEMSNILQDFFISGFKKHPSLGSEEMSLIS
jgi:hypothetical protein